MVARLLLIASTLFTGAIFGFFYAWVCSTMWGLDTADPRVAIEAMQAMNASVRNAVFFPAFFLTPIVLAVTAIVLWLGENRSGAIWIGGAALMYAAGAFATTATINVPMNEALALVQIPSDPAAAAEIWTAYSQPWQFWNIVRTLASGVSLAMVAWVLIQHPARD